MIELSLFVSPNFINQRIHKSLYPTRGAELLRILAAETEKIAVGKNFLRLSKSDSAPLVLSKLPIFEGVKVKPKAGITLIPHSAPPDFPRVGNG